MPVCRRVNLIRAVYKIVDILARENKNIIHILITLNHRFLIPRTVYPVVPPSPASSSPKEQAFRPQPINYRIYKSKGTLCKHVYML